MSRFTAFKLIVAALVVAALARTSSANGLDILRRGFRRSKSGDGPRYYGSSTAQAQAQSSTNFQHAAPQPAPPVSYANYVPHYPASHVPSAHAPASTSASASAAASASASAAASANHGNVYRAPARRLFHRPTKVQFVHPNPVEQTYRPAPRLQRFYRPASNLVSSSEASGHASATSSQVAAQTGTYNSNGHGRESSSYQRHTEGESTSEQGNEHGDHYRRSNSYGKALDKNEHEAFNHKDVDVLHTKDVFRKKKTKTNYVKTVNQAQSESGSSSLAKDKTSSGYSKSANKFKENVDDSYNLQGEGVSKAHNSHSRLDHEDENEDHFNRNGLGTFAGVNGHFEPKQHGFVGGPSANSVGNGARADASAFAS